MTQPLKDEQHLTTYLRNAESSVPGFTGIFIPRIITITAEIKTRREKENNNASTQHALHVPANSVTEGSHERRLVLEVASRGRRQAL